MSSQDRESILERRESIETPLAPERYKVLRRLFEDENHRVVVGFGGGGVPAIAGNAALVGILDELNLFDAVDEIWGTSAGAITGGAWAGGSNARQILEVMRSVQGKSSRDVKLLRFALGVLASLLPLGRPLPDGFVTGDLFLETIDRGLPVKTFEECIKPFRCIACTSDGRARRKIFHRGELLPAIFASMSLPGVVLPRELDGEIYYDGGLAEKSPLLSPIAAHLRSGDKRKLLLISTHFGNEYKQTAVRGFMGRFMHTLYAMEEQLWDYQLAEAHKRENVDLMVLNPYLADKAIFEFDNTDRNYLKARESFVDLLQNAKIAHTFGLT